MRSMKLSVIPALGALLLASACNFNTAHISSLKLGKDKAATQPTTTFAPSDTIYGVAEIGNAGKTTEKVRLIIVDVAGQQPGPIPGLETSVALDSSGTANFNFTPPTAGWPAGKYKFEVSMMDEGGVQKDQKTVDFTVAGAPAAAAAPTSTDTAAPTSTDTAAPAETAAPSSTTT
jgi:hypothetical protein